VQPADGRRSSTDHSEPGSGQQRSTVLLGAPVSREARPPPPHPRYPGAGRQTHL